MFTPMADSSRSFLVHHSFIFVLVIVKKKKNNWVRVLDSKETLVLRR